MADSFKIVASLDIDKSAKLIKNDIPKLQEYIKNEKIEITAGLNLSKSQSLIQAQLNTIANQAQAPTIHVGVDLGNSQSAVQGATNGLKTVQEQAKQTASAVKQAFVSMTADDVSDKMVSQFQKSFYIVGKKATETKSQFKSLIAEFNNGWNTGNVDTYSKALEDIYRLATQSTKATKGLDENIKQAAQEIRSTMTDGGKITIGKQLREDLKASLGTAGQIKQVLDTVYGVGKWKYASSSRKSFSGQGTFADEMVGSLKDSQSTLDAILSTYEALDKLPKNMTMFDHMDTETAKSEISKYLQEILKLPSAYQTAQSAETTYTQTAIQDVENLGAIADTLSKKLETIFMGGGQGSQPITDSAHWEKLADQANVASLAIDKIRTADSTTAESIKANAESEIAKLEQLLQSYRNIEYAIEQQGVSANNFISNNQIQASFNSLKQAEEYFKNFNIGTVTFSSNKGELQHIKDFTINVKSLTGEIEHFKYVAYNDGDNQNPIWKYQLQNINASNEAVQRLIDSQKKYQSQVEATATSLKAQLNTIQSGYTDKNSAKYITNEGNQTALANQYKVVESAIEKLKTADQNTFASMKANAEAEITTLKNMVKQFQNAEYAATSLRAKDINTNKSIQTQGLDKFISKISSSKPILDAMTGDISRLKVLLNNITDATSFTKYLNELDIAKAKFESLKALYQSIGGYNKQLDNLAKSWQKQGVYVGNVKTTVESLKNSLANVTTADGLTAWVNDFKNQIGAISEMPIKIAECRTQLDSVKQIWTDFQGKDKIISNINKEFGKLGSRLGSIKTESGLAKWSEDLAKVNSQVVGLVTNLSRQVEVQNSINNTQAQIAKLNPTKDNAEIARLNEKLSAEQQILSGLKTQSNVYNNLISYEQQEQYITEQTVASREKLTSALNASAVSYKNEITSAISTLQGLQNKSVFNTNASNSQVAQTKQDIRDLIAEYNNLMSLLETDKSPATLETVRTKLGELGTKLSQATTSAKQFEAELRNDNGAEKLAQRVALLKAQLTALSQANPKAMKQFGNEINNLMATLNNSPDGRAVDQVTKSVQLLRREINNAGLAGNTFFQKLKDDAKKFTSWMSMTYAISLFTREVRQAITELKNIDTILTEISKTSDRTEESLRRLGATSFETASKYGQKASDYLLGVQEMSRAGFGEKESEQMAELSTLAQSAGDMTADLANEYLIATNAGYKLSGSVEQLNSILD